MALLLNGVELGRGHNEKHFCEINLNLDQWFRRCCSMIFLSRGLRLFCSVELNHLYNFGREQQEEHFFNFINLNLDQWFSRFCLKIFLI